MAINDADHLTRPEQATERKQQRPLLQEVRRTGGCPFCTRRALEGWGLALCGLKPTRRFPDCLDTKNRPGFSLDETEADHYRTTRQEQTRDR